MPFLNVIPLSEDSVKHNTKIKVYPNGATEITYCKSAIFIDKAVEQVKQKKGDIIDEVFIKPEKKLDELAESRKPKRNREEEWLRVVKDRVRDIVLMNDFKYFLTITINPEQLDSFDVNAVKKKLRKWLNNMVDRKGLQYILIPEYHKSGRIHAHALVNDVLKLVDSGKRVNDKVIYNCPDWKYGFTTAIPLDDNILRVANYVTKYITKESEKIFGKHFWSSKNIQREPKIILTDSPYDEIQAEEHKPLEYCDRLAFKYENSLIYNNTRQAAPIIYTDSNGNTKECDSIEEVCELIQANDSPKN